MGITVAKIRPYLAIARFDHWIKNIFVIPGFICGYYFDLSQLQDSRRAVGTLLLGLLAAGILASSNYIMNEYLDREFDRQHPIKKNRAAANNLVSGGWVFVEYVVFLLAGFTLAWAAGRYFLAVSFVLVMMGIFYNVSPFRTKDKPYLDVLSESINNPLRFLLGWFSIQQHFIPPSSILLAYWMGGAYLMAIKRYSELRQINDSKVAASYRKSFGYYDNDRLLVSAIFYATLSTLFLGIFLIKYKIEYIISAPFVSLLFAWYLKIGFKHDSAAVAPEKLYTERKFVVYVVFFAALLLLLTFIRIPSLNILTSPTLIG
jgi:decaprenyl-phosphate phosphoribosyltransferase